MSDGRLRRRDRCSLRQYGIDGESLRQTLANQMHAMMDWAGSIASTSAPYVEWIANSGIALMSMVQLSGGIKTVVAGLKAVKVATLAQAAAAKVVAVASNIWKVAQIALNFVLSANPIGIVVMAIAALVGALIAAYNNCETFRNICDAVWAAVKKIASAVWDFLVKAFEKASAVIKKAWEWVKKFFGIKDETTARQTADLERNTKATQANTKAKTANAQTALKNNKKQNAPQQTAETAVVNRATMTNTAERSLSPMPRVTRNLATTSSTTRTNWKLPTGRIPRPLSFMQRKSQPCKSSRMR